MVSVEFAVFVTATVFCSYFAGMYEARKETFREYERQRLAYSRERMNQIREGLR